MIPKTIRAIRIVSAVALLLPILFAGQAAAYCAAPNCGEVDPGSLFGQKQAYDVLLRGNGEGIVNARLTLTNNDKNPLSKLDYSLAKGNLGEVTAFQQVSCSDLPIIKTNIPNKTTESSTLSPTAAAGPSNFATTTDIPECYPGMIEHPMDTPTSAANPQNAQPDQTSLYPNPNRNPNYPIPSYYPSGNTYKKVAVSKTGDNFTLTLPQSVKSNKSTTVVMLYNVTGIAKKSLGAFRYDFKTLKSTSKVSSVTVSVSVDEEYTLADAAKSKINYRSLTDSSSLGTNLSADKPQAANSAANSASVNNYVNNIGENGSVTRQASSLAAQETFTVKGRFASSTFLLNWPRTVFRLALAVIIIGALIYWYLRRRKRLLWQTLSNNDGAPIVTHAKALTIDDAHGLESEVFYAQRTPGINLRAIPLYALLGKLKTNLRERRIRPLFVAWFCGIAVIALVGFVLWGYSALVHLNDYNPTSTNSILMPGLFIGLAAIGFFGFLFICIGLPILFAGSFRRAMRIFMHLLIFLVVITIVLVTVVVKLSYSSDRPTKYGCAGGIEDSNINIPKYCLE